MPNYEISGNQNCSLRALCASIINMTNWLLFRHYLKLSLQYCQKWSKVEWTQLKCMMKTTKKRTKKKCPLLSINSLMVPMSREEQEGRGIYSEYFQYSTQKRRRALHSQRKPNLFITFWRRELPVIRPQNSDSQPQNVKLLCWTSTYQRIYWLCSFLPLLHSHRSLCTQAGWHSEQILCSL